MIIIIITDNNEIMMIIDCQDGHVRPEPRERAVPARAQGRNDLDLKHQ